MCHRVCTLHFLTPQISFLLDGHYSGMTMLLIPSSVLSAISLNPRKPVLEITKIPIACAIRMSDDVVTGRCRACWKPIAVSGEKQEREISLYHVLKHVSLIVCGLCCISDRVCGTWHPSLQKFPQTKDFVCSQRVPGEIVHIDLPESFIAFSRGCGMTVDKKCP